MFKKSFLGSAVLGLLAATISALIVTPASALPAEMGARPTQIGENQANVTFADLGYDQIDLVSPYDSTRILFSLPPNWQLAAGGEVELTFDVLLSGADVGQLAEARNPYGGTLTVSFNDQIIGSAPLEQIGTQTVRFSLPQEALVSTRDDARHQLVISLNAQFSCIYDIRAIISIKNTSRFNLIFQSSAPKLDLSRLPAPFYMRNALVPDTTLIVTPDSPTEQELQAAMNVLAGFGSIIGQTANFTLMTAGQLTEQDLGASNLILIGKAASLPLLSSVKLPVSVADGKFADLPAESAQDGILEMAVSPWNTNKVVLLVSGNDDAAVSKAAQAVSSGKVFTYENPAVAYVSEVQPLAQTLPVVQDFTLADLGYTTDTLTGIGLNNVEYIFYASKEQVASKDGTIDVAYYHAGLLSYGVSAMSVTLNDQIIGSAVFNKDSEQLTTLHVKVPQGVLRFGENRLGISTNLLVETSCDTTGFSDPWLVVSDQTAFHLPAGTPDATAGQRQLDLKFFPSTFTSQSDFGDLALIVPKSNLASWRVAGQIAYRLGMDANPSISNMKVAYADNVPADVRDRSSLILVGKASDLGLLSDLNDKLPAPFDLKNNTATERDMQIVYRVPPGVSVGYLQLLHSPYNLDRALLVASGNDDQGLAMAGTALTTDPLRSRLAGQFAVTNGVQVATGGSSSQFSVVGTAVPGAEPVVATPIAPATVFQPGFVRPGWLSMLGIISGIIVLLILVYVIAVAVARGREPAAARAQRQGKAPGEHDRD